MESGAVITVGAAHGQDGIDFGSADQFNLVRNVCCWRDHRLRQLVKARIRVLSTEQTVAVLVLIIKSRQRSGVKRIGHLAISSEPCAAVLHAACPQT